MRLQIKRHLIKIQEQARKRPAVHLQNRITWIHHINRNITGEGVYHSFNAVADVVETIIGHGGIRIAIGCGKAILQPPQLPCLINHRVWGKKRLAYPIEKQKYGSFILMQFEGGNQSKMVDFDTWMKLNDSVLRHMIVGLEQKPDVYVEESKTDPGVDKEITPVETASETKDGKIENNDISTKRAIESDPEDQEKEELPDRLVEQLTKCCH